MKRTLLALIILGIGFASCNKEPQPLTKKEIKQKIDSITSVRIKESDAQAQRDLQHRIEIEVKVKADSILNATLQHAKDSLNKPKVNTQPARPHILGNI
jgi:hypothetical protein